jgi:uncharacterized coiled-coil protein SlyX
MRYLTNAALTIFVWMMLVSFPILGQAEDLSREQISEYGFIDWLNQKVYANGVGIAPKDKQNQTQAKTLAYRAAVVVAQRNLLEVIKGVHINSETILEDRIVTDDIIVSKIEGVVKFSQVENSQLLENNAVSVTLSMPLTGRMGEVLIRAIEGTGKPSPTISAPQNMNDRLHRLETRVATLENKLSRLNEISVEQKSVMHLLTYLVEAWQNDTDRQARILKVGFASEKETAALGYQIDEQNKQMASMSIHLKNLSRRLAVLENNMSTEETSPQSETRKKAYPYTGLIVDARDTGFKPSLRPELYHQGELIYPGDYLNLSKTVQSGYVRYYNTRYQAQQSDRMGSLPLATKATGTAGGDRGLSIDNETSKILKAVLQEPDNFMARCRVIIIF